MAGVAKPRRRVDTCRQSPQRAGRAPGADHGSKLCKDRFLRFAAVRPGRSERPLPAHSVAKLHFASAARRARAATRAQSQSCWPRLLQCGRVLQCSSRGKARSPRRCRSPVWSVQDRNRCEQARALDPLASPTASQPSPAPPASALPRSTTAPASRDRFACPRHTAA